MQNVQNRKNSQFYYPISQDQKYGRKNNKLTQSMDQKNKKIQNNFVLNDRTQTPFTQDGTQQSRRNSRPGTTQQTSRNNYILSEGKKNNLQAQNTDASNPYQNLNCGQEYKNNHTQEADLDSQSSDQQRQDKQIQGLKKKMSADQRLKRFKKIVEKQKPYHDFIKLHNTPYDPNWDKVPTFQQYCPPYIYKALEDLEKHESNPDPQKHIKLGDLLGDHKMEVHRVKFRLQNYNKTKVSHLIQVCDPVSQPVSPKSSPKFLLKQQMIETYKKNDDKIEKLLILEPKLRK